MNTGSTSPLTTNPPPRVLGCKNPAEVVLHRRVPEIVNKAMPLAYAAGAPSRRLSFPTKIERFSDRSWVYCTPVRAVTFWPSLGRAIAKFDGTTASSIPLASWPKTGLAAEIRMTSFPQAQLLGIEVEQIITAAAIREPLRETAGSHSLVVFGEIAEERQAVRGETVS